MYTLLELSLYIYIQLEVKLCYNLNNLAKTYLKHNAPTNIPKIIYLNNFLKITSLAMHFVV